MINLISGKNCMSYKVEIFLSGPIEVAKQVLREDCKRKGLCVTIEETLFIYTGGEENGYRVGLLNYPRFPDTAENLWNRAVYLAEKLLEVTFQNSALVTDWENTLWLSNRKEE